MDGISICITAYKAEKFIKECLDSIYTQSWFKDHDNWEVIVGIDNCEDTLKRINEIISNYYNIRVLMMDSNKGTYVTTNTIMKEAKYDWLLRFDSDDLMRPYMVETLMDNRKADIVTFDLQNFGANRNAGLSAGVLMLRRTAFIRFGGFKPWRCAADTELLVRLTDLAKYHHIDKILFDRRVHMESLTQKKGETCCFNGRTGVLRAKYQKYVADLRRIKVKTERYAVIPCVTNTFTEIVNIGPKEEGKAYEESPTSLWAQMFNVLNTYGKQMENQYLKRLGGKPFTEEEFNVLKQEIKDKLGF